MFNDYTLGGSFRHPRSYLWVLAAAMLEPFLYHPLTVIFSLKGYYNYIFNKRAVWGEMSRTGYAAPGAGAPPPDAKVAPAAAGPAQAQGMKGGDV